MKALFSILFFFSVQTVFAADPKMCENLKSDLTKSCEEALCQDFVLVGEPCVFDGPFIEKFNSCITDNLDFFVTEYNKLHPEENFVCSVD